MKVIESGMPEEHVWESFFNVDKILNKLEISPEIKTLVEIGCGYGTFTVPAAKRVGERMYSFDIEKEMIDYTEKKSKQSHLNNLILENRDILKDTTGLAENSTDYLMLFNILHHHAPKAFYTEAYRILKPGGRIGIIHWRSDIETPRGPSLSIRPKPQEILDQINADQFEIEKKPFNLEPFHYGLMVRKI